MMFVFSEEAEGEEEEEEEGEEKTRPNCCTVANR